MTAPVEAGASPALALRRTVESATLAILLAFSVLMGWDNWRTGVRWESTGPQAGYFPFYVSIILGGACIYGLVLEAISWKKSGEAFVKRDQFKRVLQVFVPTLVFVPATQFLGLYLASFALVTGFMIWIGKIRPWIAVLTGFVFSVIMFSVFEVAFDVIMPKGPLERMFGF